MLDYKLHDDVIASVLVAAAGALLTLFFDEVSRRVRSVLPLGQHIASAC
jgi:hypothetical protein